MSGDLSPEGARNTTYCENEVRARESCREVKINDNLSARRLCLSRRTDEPAAASSIPAVTVGHGEVSPPFASACNVQKLRSFSDH